jgi:hypothetical protein
MADLLVEPVKNPTKKYSKQGTIVDITPHQTNTCYNKDFSCIFINTASIVFFIKQPYSMCERSALGHTIHSTYF